MMTRRISSISSSRLSRASSVSFIPSSVFLFTSPFAGRSARRAQQVAPGGGLSYFSRYQFDENQTPPPEMLCIACLPSKGRLSGGCRASVEFADHFGYDTPARFSDFAVLALRFGS